jgi:hypothetical protein
VDHIAANLAKIEQNIKVNSADPIARYGFTQLPNFILRNPELSAKRQDSLLFASQLRLAQQLMLSRPGAHGRAYGRPRVDS